MRGSILITKQWVQQSSLHIGATLQNGILRSTGGPKVVLDSENYCADKLLLNLMKLWWTPTQNRQHKWYVPSCCHGLFPLYNNALQSVVMVYACSPHRDEFSCNLWDEEGLIHGSFDLTLMLSMFTWSSSKGSFQTWEWPNETSRAQQLTIWTLIAVHLWNDDEHSPHCADTVHQIFDSLFHQSTCWLLWSAERSWGK